MMIKKTVYGLILAMNRFFISTSETLFKKIDSIFVQSDTQKEGGK